MYTPEPKTVIGTYGEGRTTSVAFVDAFFNERICAVSEKDKLSVSVSVYTYRNK